MLPLARRRELGLREHARDGRHTVALNGELDLGTASQLETAIDRICDDGAREIVLDLRELSFIDSSGLRATLACRKVCESRGCEFSLTSVQAPVRRVFELTGLVERLSIRGKVLAGRLPHRRRSTVKLPLGLFRPDFERPVDLDPGAPRSARNYVGDLVWEDAPQDLREAIMLLTSELVARAAQRRHADGQAVLLRAWMRTDVARVELRMPRELLLAPPEHGEPLYDQMLLDQLADRWSIETGEDDACVWFESDRHKA
jgi:anti-sigma B factor antagonist